MSLNGVIWLVRIYIVDLNLLELRVSYGFCTLFIEMFLNTGLVN